EATINPMTARAYASSEAPESASLEQRIEVLEKNLSTVRDDLSALKEETDRRDRAHTEDLKRERTEREAGDLSLHEKIKDVETGALHLDVAGVWLLLSG